MFDPESFMNQTVEGPMETSITPVPVGEYPAQIDDTQLREFTSDKGQHFVVLRVMWNVLDDAVKAELGREKVTVRQEMFLDFDENGRLAVGPDKNVRLGQLREALGQNEGPWSPGMLKGAGPALVKVGHRPNERDPKSPFAEVERVTRYGG